MPERQLDLDLGPLPAARPDEHPATAIEDVVGSTRRKIRRIRPPVKAHGGKYYLAPKIVPVLLSAPGEPDEYLEPCVFGGSVFLAMPRFRREILGDVNPDVINLWRAFSRRHVAKALQHDLDRTPYTEESFDAARSGNSPSDSGSAADFIVRSRFSRGGLGKTFAWSERTRGGKPGDVNSWDTFRSKVLPAVIDRAEGAEVVRDACWATVWESRDRAKRLIYADPPYVRETRTAKDTYGPFEMPLLQHFWLVSALKAHSGPAALSGYRCGDYDRWLREWRRIDFDMPNNSGQGKKKQRRTESLWINW